MSLNSPFPSFSFFFLFLFNKVSKTPDRSVEKCSYNILTTYEIEHSQFLEYKLLSNF